MAVADNRAAEEYSELADEKVSQSDVTFFDEVVEKYYKRNLPSSLDVYLHLAEQPMTVRQKIQQDPFWKKVGKYLHVIDFSTEERIKFAEESDVGLLCVLLLFEKDLTVLDVVFNNPRLGTKLLLDYISLIRERDIDWEDDKILKLAQKIFHQRRARIVKSTEIQKITAGGQSRENLIRLFGFLNDDDKYIQAAAENAIGLINPKQFTDLLELDDLTESFVEMHPSINGLEFLNILRSVVRLMLKNIETSQIFDTGSNKESQKKLSETLKQKWGEWKYKQVKRCGTSPTDLFNITQVAFFHFDSDDRIKEHARDAFGLKDLLDLISDESTPRKIADGVMGIMNKFGDAELKGYIQEIRIKEAARLNKKMKEIEVSINAYFDIIFSSLGYSKINTYKAAISTLSEAIGHLKRYYSSDNKADSESAEITQESLGRALAFYEETMADVYQETNKHIIEEALEMRGMIKNILSLKRFEFEEGKPLTEPDQKTLDKVDGIWRFSVSQYLGRIKDLDEMLHLKLCDFMEEQESMEASQSLGKELQLAAAEIESDHKKAVDCKLTIDCVDCKHRGCASERFLQEAEFLLDELNHNTSAVKNRA